LRISGLFPSPFIALPLAHSLQDTIEAYSSIRTLHVKAFGTVDEQTWHSESWMAFDEYGKPMQFRHQADQISTGSRDRLSP